jgi:hypothetical protein
VKALAREALPNTVMKPEAAVARIPIDVVPLRTTTNVTTRPAAHAAKTAAVRFKGKPERVYRPNVLWQVVFLLVALVFFGLVGAFVAPQIHKPLHLYPKSVWPILAVFGACGLLFTYAALRSLGRKYLIYPEGFVHVYQGKSTLVAWDEIRWLARDPALLIATGKGKVLTLTCEIWGYRELGSLIEERMAQAQLPALLESLEEGRVASFGPISADSTGIYYQEHAIPWHRLLSLAYGLDFKEKDWRRRAWKGLFLRINFEIQVKLGEARNRRLLELLVLHHQPACQVERLC